MGKNNLIYVVVLFVAVFTLSGCGTAKKNIREEVKGIKSQVESLQSRVETVEMRQAEAERIQAERAQMAEDTVQAGTNISVAPKPARTKERIKDIQACLKNAGYYEGNIDGVKGRKTRKAIREFQKANDLTADGVVGQKTWAALSKYSQGTTGIGEETK